MPGSLSEEQLAHYWEYGYTVAQGLLPAEELERWNTRLQDIIEGRVPAAKRMLVMRDVMIARGAVETERDVEAIAKIQDFENDPVLDAYNQHERVLDCVEQIIGPDIQTIHCMLINKPPNVDGRHPLHQDLVYFPFRPAHAIVASWTALERVTKENGCLVVVPGTHKGPLLEHENMEWEYVNAGYWGAEGVGEATERIHLECEPGDTVFFHSLILHGSGRNKTPGFRRAISCHYCSTQVEKTWDEREEDDDTRWYRHIRGRAPDHGEVPRTAERPGQPALLAPRRSTRRA